MLRRLLIFVLLLVVGGTWAADNAFRFIVLDVGEGEAILLQQGNRGVLIDTGHIGKPAYVMQQMQSYGVEQLDGIILTNLRPERAGGYFYLRQHFPEVPLYYNGHDLPDNIAPDSSRWLEQGIEADSHRNVLRQGGSIQWQQVAIHALWPDKIYGHDINRHSLVLEINYQSHKMLIMSNAGQDVEAVLLARHLLPQKVDVLVVGYYGAGFSSSIAFLSHVQPRYGIISVNKGNVRGFPHSAVIARLKRLSSTVLRTDQQGDVCLAFAGEKVKPCH
jgi:competence protein ComEC